ncbi:MAG: hypothetical protein AABX31_01320 [Nanoarchaeota archaeon]
MQKRDDFYTGVKVGVLYTSAAGLALLGFLGACAYVYHLETQTKIKQCQERVEQLEDKIETWYKKR